MEIIYQDNDILAVWKPAGLAVQSKNPLESDLESLLLTYLSQEKVTHAETVPTGNGTNEKPNHKKKEASKNSIKRTRAYSTPELHIINRLDQPVEGLVLFALNKKAAAALTRQLTEGKIEKIYRAEVTGPIPKDEDILEDYLLKDARTNTSRVVAPDTPNAKRSILSYKKITENELEISLMTGRHHQIRVQLAHAGMPILGDRKYGDPSPLYKGRLMLTASRLSFDHPRTGRRMELKR